jgi:hypothetical protein
VPVRIRSPVVFHRTQVVDSGKTAEAGNGKTSNNSAVVVIIIKQVGRNLAAGRERRVVQMGI